MDPGKGDYRVKETSPALPLGFKNFPMDQFGVTDPKLKALARTPFAAGTSAPQTQMAARDPALRDFLGAKIKNVISLGEVSAYGLPGEMGVIVVQVPAGSAADKAGLKQGDVVLKWQNRDIGSVDDLLKNYGGGVKGSKASLSVWRTQHEVIVEINVE